MKNRRSEDGTKNREGSSFLYTGDDAKHISCLNIEPHSENITDKLIHYLGCIQYCDRKKYYDSLEHDKQEQIQTELRRITYLRQVLLDAPDSVSCFAKNISESLADWKAQDKYDDRLKEVIDWRKKFGGPERCEQHDPTAGHPQTNPSNRKYDPLVDINAYVMQFKDSKGWTDESKRPDSTPSFPPCPIYKGKFPNQKISVASLLRDDIINPLNKKEFEEKDEYRKRVRYFHLPYNNMTVSADQYCPRIDNCS